MTRFHAPGCTGMGGTPPRRGHGLRPGGSARGFTLIEVLISMAIIALLSVVIIPRAIQLVEKMTANRIAAELGALRSAANAFQLGTGTFPLRVSHLNNPITAADRNTAQILYLQRHIAQWNGPYTDLDLAANLGSVTARPIGFGASLHNQLICFNPANNQPVTSSPFCRDNSFVALRIAGLLGYQFDLLNLQVDGDESADPGFGRQTGKLRFIATGGIDLAVQTGVTYYLIGPWSAVR